ncbi:MAG: hypothetical protein QM535_10425 [Limnohabitans sp.]|nr:hypothetical protein [Limnohabitans sp.]
MKNASIYIISLFALLVSCKKEQKPKVKYDKQTPKTEIKQDTSTVQVADLPIQLENSSVLIYPIGDLRVSDVQKTAYESSRYDEKSGFRFSNSLDNEISGYIRNVKFQKKELDSLYVLTDKVVLIERITYLKDKKAFIYLLADADTNQDNVVDGDDIKSLYLSNEFGQNFTKISPEIQEIIDWNYIPSSNKIFFRTIDDRNKNGAFDKNDNIHYFNINLTKEWKAEEYFPVK